MKLPKLKIKKEGQITDINGRKKKFIVINYVSLKQSTYPKKVFVLQELLFDDGKKK